MGSIPSRFHARSANERPGNDLDVDARTAQQHDRALRDRRTPGYRVRNLTVFLRGLDHAGRDRGVHGVEIVTRVVEQVERLEHQTLACELIDSRMARGAHVADRNALQRGACRGQQQVDAGRTETDHDDAGSVHPPASGVEWWWSWWEASPGPCADSGTSGGVTR